MLGLDSKERTAVLLRIHAILGCEVIIAGDVLCFLLDLLLGLLASKAEPLVDFAFEEAELFAVFVDGDEVLAYPVVDC